MAKTTDNYLTAACCLGVSALIVLIVSFSTDYWVTGDYMVYRLSLEINQVNHGLFTGTIKKGVSPSKTYPLVMTCNLADGYLGYCAWSCKGTAEERYAEVKALYNALFIPQIPDVRCTAEEIGKTSPDFQSYRVIDTLLFPAGLIWVSTILFLSMAVFFDVIALGFNVWKTISSTKSSFASTIALYIYYGIAASCTLLTIILWGIEFGAYSSHNLGLTQTIVYSSYLMEPSAELNYSYFLLIVAFLEQSIAIVVLNRRKWNRVNMRRQNYLREQAATSGAQT